MNWRKWQAAKLVICGMAVFGILIFVLGKVGQEREALAGQQARIQCTGQYETVECFDRRKLVLLLQQQIDKLNGVAK